MSPDKEEARIQSWEDIDKACEMLGITREDLLVYCMSWKELESGSNA